MCLARPPHCAPAAHQHSLRPFALRAFPPPSRLAHSAALPPHSLLRRLAAGGCSRGMPLLAWRASTSLLRIRSANGPAPAALRARSTLPPAVSSARTSAGWPRIACGAVAAAPAVAALGCPAAQPAGRKRGGSGTMAGGSRVPGRVVVGGDAAPPRAADSCPLPSIVDCTPATPAPTPSPATQPATLPNSSTRPTHSFSTSTPIHHSSAGLHFAPPPPPPPAYRPICRPVDPPTTHSPIRPSPAITTRCRSRPLQNQLPFAHPRARPSHPLPQPPLPTWPPT